MLTSVERTTVLRRRVRLVVAATITYNAIEAAVALTAGAAASSSALIGFGLDSVIEVLSAAAIAWQFAGGRNHEDREHVALRVVAFSFFGLAAFVTVDAVRELGSASVVADSRQTLLCAALSAVLLVGLVANSALGWSWADPLAALVIAGFAVREGREALRGDTCCTPVAVLLAEPGADVDDACCAAEGQ